MSRQLQCLEGAIHPSAEARREYFRLPGDLAELARGFQINLPREHHRDAAVLVFSIECVDRVLDSLSEADERKRFSAAVIALLKGEAVLEIVVFSSEIRQWLDALRKIIQRRQIRPEFCRVTGALLANCEEMRRTRNPAAFVDGAAREGRLMVELLLLILGDVATPNFTEFMREVGEPANLGDKLRDARRDFSAGELAIRPGLKFHARLAYEMFRRVLSLAFRFSGRGRVLAWGLKSLFVELALARP
jgi:hypothetical protein